MNQPTNQNFQEDVAPVRREMTLEIQKVYDDYPWLSHGITTNDSRLTSAPL